MADSKSELAETQAALRKLLDQTEARVREAKAEVDAAQACVAARTEELEDLRAEARGDTFCIALTHDAVHPDDFACVTRLSDVDLCFDVHLVVSDRRSGAPVYDASLTISGNYYVSGSRNWEVHDRELDVTRAAPARVRELIYSQARGEQMSCKFDDTLLDGDDVLAHLLLQGGEENEENEENEEEEGGEEGGGATGMSPI